ncbi:MAG: substrate-binding domain-containing protein [Dehalococcoidia bacterium]|nr:substrate-binding domain-containing protein [Dehalococcoidia bacterium]
MKNPVLNCLVTRLLLASVLLVLVVTAVGCGTRPAQTSNATETPPAPANPDIILATTTSTRDSGLLDVLLPIFEQKTGYRVKPIAVGSGQAMAMGGRGEADVLLVHAPDSEVKFMQAGHGVNRKLVMHNDFIIIGPDADTAGIKGMTVAVDALKKISTSNAIFVSRGDNSGTHQLELKLWKLASIEPKGQTWYQETGQGMGATLNITAEKGGYTITDRATYLSTEKTTNLKILAEKDPILLNIYHVIQVNPAKSEKINAAGARAFVDFMVGADTQKMLGEFGKDKYGQALFFPDAGKTEAELGSQ